MKTSQTELRDALKVALQHAKEVFDEGLVDEKEYADLKQHALHNYKDALASLPVVEQSNPSTPPRQPRPPAEPHKGIPPEQDSTPALQKAHQSHVEAVDVDPDVYERLRTPPIFRRRSATARRTVVLSCNDLDVLQSHE